ncbi:helix-hairpin-helix domain-containing protein [Actinomadura craniellae]|uniref:Helix-hairpin-helix domain-containing protein n=1 Tax=Actinomadura craniellae TaxID=2231787 RepID=A0A365H2H7_9ACTN|nr:helix-hairpin-helix domain-containing protein [Actinomadura craniellae]RAY13192.1 helix-hairpin-helix domain-containing protein [Actinomadura craniellae]
MNVPAPYEPRVPSDSMPPGRAALSVTWAALPFLTFGLATPFTFAAAALWRRTWHLLLAALVYSGVFALQVLAAPELEIAQEAGESGWSTAGLLAGFQAIVGCAHAFIVRRRVFDPSGAAGLAGNEKAIERVRRQRLMRQKARELAAADPGLARELRIGRPDLPRQYDDGGLIDFNHAPAEALTLLPGLTPELAARIVRVREDTGGFMSAEELSALAELPPALTADLAEYGLFLR